MIFGKKKKIAVQIEDSSINIIVGNIGNVISSKIIELPKGICEDGNILRQEVIINFIDDYLEGNKIKAKDISFVINGSDIVTRIIEVPILKDKALREALEYEISQFIPNLNDYYMDYEIIEKINTEEKKAYKVLVVASSKEKVDALVNISEKLEKELDVIDISSNCLARVIKNSGLFSKENSLAVFFLGKSSSTFSIIEGGVSKIERALPFGANNIMGEFELKEEDRKNVNIDIKDLLADNMRLQLSFENLLSTISNTLRYHNSSFGSKLVNKFLIVCEDSIIVGLDKYMEKHFTLPCIAINEPIDMDLKIKLEGNFSKYIASYGLLLRRD